MHLVGESRAASLHRLIPLSDGRVPYLLQNHSRRRAHVERWIEELLRSSDRLSAEGVRVAEPAARGWALAREGGTMGFVIVLAPPGAVELDTTLRRVPSGRAELLREVAALVAGLHSRGVRLGRLYAWNVLVTLEGTFLLLDSGGRDSRKGTGFRLRRTWPRFPPRSKLQLSAPPSGGGFSRRTPVQEDLPGSRARFGRSGIASIGRSAGCGVKACSHAPSPSWTAGSRTAGCVWR